MRKLVILGAIILIVSIVFILLPKQNDHASDQATIQTATTEPDFLDPALGYSTVSWEPMFVVYIPLLTYKHAEGNEGTQLIPGLAQSLPEISEDGLLYTLQLRQGLKYSDGTTVYASDFKHAIRRVLRLLSQGSSFFEVIVGAKDYALKKADDIAGIVCDNETGKIQIRIENKSASFQYVLAMLFAAPVPGNTPFENMTEKPIPGTGQYYFAVSKPGYEYVLEQNPFFNIPNLPKGNLKKITAQIMNSLENQAMAVLNNQLDYMHHEPPADFLNIILQKAQERYKEHSVESIYFYFLRVDQEPFDNEQVRQAVAYSVDRQAIVRLYAGLLTPSNNFLSPSIPGYKKMDNSYPTNIEKAKELIRLAGAEGKKVKVYGKNDGPERAATEYIAGVLNKIGLDASIVLVERKVYNQVIGVKKNNAQIGINTWFMDFPHPSNFFFLLDGKTIRDVSNENPGCVSDAFVNTEIEALTQISNVDSTIIGRWAKLDELVTKKVYVIPFGHKLYTTFFSKRMDMDKAILHPVYQHDYTSWQLK